MIPELTATRFLKVMGSGRTQPCLLVGEDADGNEVEVVVKLRGHPQMMPGGMVAEALASLLATDLGLPVPPPYRMTIEKEFAQTVPDPILRGHLEKSVGLNFASGRWAAGHAIWPKDRFISKTLKPVAMEIFAFDGLIQNPDRRAVNPNCVFLGDEFMLYDHESAFSHFLDIFPKPPWEPSGMKCLSEHIFRNELRGEGLKLDRFQGALEALDESRFQGYLDEIPGEWNGPTVRGDKIAEYLLNCIPQFDRIKVQLQSLL
jgi:hypothetical protein